MTTIKRISISSLLIISLLLVGCGGQQASQPVSSKKQATEEKGAKKAKEEKDKQQPVKEAAPAKQTEAEELKDYLKAEEVFKGLQAYTEARNSFEGEKVVEYKYYTPDQLAGLNRRELEKTMYTERKESIKKYEVDGIKMYGEIQKTALGGDKEARYWAQVMYMENEHKRVEEGKDPRSQKCIMVAVLAFDEQRKEWLVNNEVMLTVFSTGGDSAFGDWMDYAFAGEGQGKDIYDYAGWYMENISEG